MMQRRRVHLRVSSSAARGNSLCVMQRGQALILAVLLLPACLLLLYAAFNVSRIASARSAIAQAADNAAYSGAVHNARALNYMAYLNRAMIVNHVTAAQAVTASSYLGYQEQNTRRLCLAFCAVPYLGQVVRSVDQLVHGGQQMADRLAPVSLRLVDLMNSGLQASQHAVWLAAAAQLPEVVRSVARANHQQVRVAEIPLQQARLRYLHWIRRYESESERWRFAHAVTGALDDWTVNRGHDGLQWIRHLLPVPLVIRDLRFSRRGGTELTDLRHWESVDTLSLKFKVPRWNLRWRDGERPPLGWNSREAGQGRHNRLPSAFGRSGADNPLATRFAWSEQQNLYGAYAGMGSYLDLERNHRRKGLSVLVEVNLPASAAGSANQANSRLRAGPSMRMKDGLINQQLAAIAKAEAHFIRPQPRRDGNEELASTFNPYWRARLVSPEPAELRQADLTSGRGTLSFASTL